MEFFFAYSVLNESFFCLWALLFLANASLKG